MNRNVGILLVEDDRLDVKTLLRAFREVQVRNPLYVVANGEEALRFLRCEPPYDDPNRPKRPGLILLDLNLPVMSGLEFLRAYRRDPTLDTIPTVVLTTSGENRDLVESYRAGVAGYIKKPVSYPSFVSAIRNFDRYWNLCILP